MDTHYIKVVFDVRVLNKNVLFKFFCHSITLNFGKHNASKGSFSYPPMNGSLNELHCNQINQLGSPGKVIGQVPCLLGSYFGSSDFSNWYAPTQQSLRLSASKPTED